MRVSKLVVSLLFSSVPVYSFPCHCRNTARESIRARRQSGRRTEPVRSRDTRWMRGGVTPSSRRHRDRFQTYKSASAVSGGGHTIH
ncbi:hypothetical protein BaRGS_00033586 [Batillaria attramentaria]|uniref:Secreted protein n=1 Tax=Batillaria attramentaria TaxID=370345 RepID=A0ABD0JKF4_9CAEN